MTRANITIETAGDRARMDAVYRLAHDAYVERGFIEPRADGRLIHYAHLDGIPETTVLAAMELIAATVRAALEKGVGRWKGALRRFSAPWAGRNDLFASRATCSCGRSCGYRILFYATKHMEHPNRGAFRAISPVAD